MKTRQQTTVSVFVLLLALLTTQAASAFYNPEIGRWANRDPIKELGGINLYTFVRNQPTIRHDNYGLYGVPGSSDCTGLLLQIEQLEKNIEAAAAEGQDDPGMYAELAALQALFALNCTIPPQPPTPCPIRIPHHPPHPDQNNRSFYCQRHPIICGTLIFVGTGAVMIGGAILVAF